MSDDKEKPPNGGDVSDKEKTAQELADEKNVAAQAEAAKVEAENADAEKAKLRRHLGWIEETAKELAEAIEAIPDGVQHGWHSLAAEINARVKR